MNSTYTITPLVIARGVGREMSRFTYLNNYGVKFDIPYLAFLIQGSDLNVLVDAACSADDYKRWIKPADADALHLGGRPIAGHPGRRGLWLRRRRNRACSRQTVHRGRRRRRRHGCVRRPGPRLGPRHRSACVLSHARERAALRRLLAGHRRTSAGI